MRNEKKILNIVGKILKKYLRNPAVSCAYFLQHHDSMDLLALLKEYP